MSGPMLSWLLLLAQQVIALSEVAVKDEVCVKDNSVQRHDAALLQVKRSTMEASHIVSTEDALMPTFARDSSCRGCAEARGIGSTAPLNAPGFREVQKKCCSKEMSAFIQRLIESKGDGVCYRGGLRGMSIWYDCEDDGIAGRGFQALEKSIGPDSKARTGDCPWIGKPSACPTQSPSCPSFPDAVDPTPCEEETTIVTTPTTTEEETTILTTPTTTPAPPFCSSSTTPGATAWEDYFQDGVQTGITVKVDTSMCGFTAEPVYTTSLGGAGSQAYTTGGSEVYKATEKDFQIYIVTTFDASKANSKKWHINWIAHEQGFTSYPSATSCAGKTLKGATSWVQNPNNENGLYVDVDTTVCGYTTAPVYQTALGGSRRHWRTRGGSEIYQETSSGFRNYIFYDTVADATPTNANTWNWHMAWIAHPTGVTSYPSGSSCAGETATEGWVQYDGSTIYIDVDTTTCGFTATPVYVTTLIGNDQSMHWQSRGSSEVYKVTPSSCRVHIAYPRITPDQAIEWGWHIGWIAVTNGLVR